MYTNKKILAALAIFATAIGSTSTQAATLSFSGADAHQVDVDTHSLVAAGLTSPNSAYINAATNTVVSGSGAFLETFDASATGTNGIGATTRPTLGDPNFTAIQYGGPNGGFVSLNPNDPWNGGDLTISNGGENGKGMGIRKGTTGFAASPGGVCGALPCDQTYFAYGPGQQGNLPASVNVSYSTLLNASGPGSRIDYLGVYFGSVDTYNEIDFYGADGKLMTGLFGGGILSGSDILTAMGCLNLSTCSGSQSGKYSNVYLNIAFDPGEQFTSFSFKTYGVAFEIDNVVTHVDAATTRQVPEPASLLLFGLGLLGLSGIRRKSK